MRKLAYIVFMAMMIALLASGCFKMAPTAQLETEEAIFILKNGSIEVKAAKELSGLEVFLKAKVEESEVSAKGTCAIVKQFEDGTYIATAIGGKFKSGETVMTIRGGFTDLNKLSIETMGVELEEEYGPQSQVPEDGVYVQDTWVSSNASGNKLIIGARNLNIGDYSDTPINGFSFVVKYDPADIEITNVVNSVLDPTIETFEIDNSTGELNVYAGYPDESGVFIVAPTELLEITFSSKGVKTVSEVTLEDVQVTVFDSNSEWNPVDIFADGTGGFITIGNPKLLGDFNLDGIVGTADLAEFATYYRETYTVITDLLAYYDIGPAKKAYGGAWEHIYTEANPDRNVDLLDLVIMAQNWAVPKPTDFNYVKTLDELNAAIASDSFTSIVFGSNISGTPNEVGRLVDINLNGYTLTGNLSFDTGDSGTINLYAGTISGNLTVNAPNATFNNYANVTGEITINGVSAGTWNEYFCENNLVWDAEDSTLYVYCGAQGITFNANASRVVFDGPAIVTGGHFIEYAIIAPGTNVTFDTPPQHVEILDGTVWNSRTGSFYSTIQTAINAAGSGDTIFVGAGTYAEQLVINKSLTLKGPNAGTHGFSDNRVPEAKLVFPDDPVYFDSPLEDVPLVWRVLVEIGSENVTVDGFSFSNEGLFSEIKYMGGVFSYKGSLKVTNNAFEGFTTAIKTDIPINTVYIENVEISYNYVHDNVRWTNSSIYIQGAGAEVFENVTKDVGNSIQIQPYSNPNAGSVHDNQFESWLLGIWYNYAEKGSGEWTITDNTLTAASYPTVAEPKNWRGIDVQTFGSSGSGDAPRVEFRYNTIDAAKIIDEDRFDTVIGIRMSSPVSDDAVAVFENNTFNVRTGALRLDGTLNLGTVLSSNTFPEGFAVNAVGDMIGKFKVTNTTKKKGYDTIQAAINAADAGDVIEVAEGAHTIDSQININKAVTLRGVGTNEEWKTKLQVSGSGYRLSVSAGATIENFEIEKTDKTGVQNIIGIFASEVSIKSNKIYGRYELGDGEVSRAMEISGGLTDVLIENNEIYSLRQPAYINPNTTGSIKDNHVYLTRGWVIDGALMTFNGNTWGTGDNANATDIALLIGTTLGEPYDDLEALKSANNNASIEDQRVNPDSIYVNASSAKSEGSPTYPFKTIAEGLNAVNENGTIYVAEGTYNENVIINKQGIKLNGEGYEDSSCTKINGGIAVTKANVEISGFMISGGGVAYSNAKAGIYIVGGTTGHKITGNKLVGNGNDPASGPGILFGYNASNVEINSSVIMNWYQGMYINPSSNIVIEENTLELNNVGIGSDGLNDVSIIRNQFKNNIFEDWGSSNVGVSVSAQYNTFTHGEDSACRAVAHYSGNMINATCNWWGSADPAVIAGKVSGLVDWSPFWITAVGPCDGNAPVRNTTIDLPYATIQAAFDDLYALDKPAEPTTYTIEVKKGTYDEQLLIKQQENKNIVLRAVDGDEVVLRRTVIINGQGRHNGEESLTISGFDFTYEGFEGLGGGKDFIVTTDPSGATNGYAHNVTIEHCSFSGDPNEDSPSFVAIRNLKAGYDFMISYCQGDHLHSLAQFASAVTGAKIENCTLVDCKSGLNLNASTNVEVDGLWFEGPGYGIRAGQSSGSPVDSTLVISNSVLIGTSGCTAADLGDPDTALVLRGDSPKNITISGSVIMNTNPGSYAIANVNSLNAGSYSLTISGNYWGETDYSSGLLGGLGDAGVTCASYYQDAAYTTAPPTLSNLVNIP